jgi:hypothetical protein
MTDTSNRQPILYSDDVEQLLPNESDIIDETIETMRLTMAKTFETVRHGTSGTHAKSHGVVTGSLQVLPDLTPELAQGLFASPGQFEVVARFASEPGAIDPDQATRARGLALKVLNVPGEKLREGWTSQDFLFNTWPIIPQGDAQVYLDAIKARFEHHGNYAATLAATTLKHPAPKGTVFDRTPNIDIMAHRYYSQGAFRYGDHVAKFAMIPVAPEQLTLEDRKVGRKDSPGVLSEWMQEYFQQHEARYELRVQLNVDLPSMPIEDASVEWDEQESPYRPVATVTFPPQESFGPARRVFAEDVMSWRPWFGLAAFRPLGSINRVRREGYERLGAVRHQRNARNEVDPVSLDQIPD